MIGFSAINGKIRLINFAIFVAIIEVVLVGIWKEEESESLVVYTLFSIFFGIIIQLVTVTFKYLIKARTEFLYDIEKKQLEKGNELLRKEIDIRIESEKQLENARFELFLQKSALEKLQHAIDRHAIIVIFDRKAKIVFTNRKFLEITEKMEDDWIGRSILSIKSDLHDKKFYHNIWKRVLKGTIWQGEMNIQFENSMIWVDATIAPIVTTNHKNEQFICISNLINERKRVEHELILSLNKEKELAEFKNRLISMISHEFRTPLTSVQLSTETLIRFSHRITNETKEKLLNTISESCKRMDSLIDDALIMNKSDSGNMRFLPEKGNLKQFCQSVTDEINLISQKRIQIKFQYEVSGGEEFIFDANLLRYALSNLLNNAVKYSDKEEDVLFCVNSAEGDLLFTVQDFGIGIPEDEKSKVFDPFHRAKNVGTRSGTGLGMAIAQKSAIMHGGEIRFESKEGEGTTFFLRIPMLKAESL
jgi:PAS domain S-box-containing protein